MLAQFEGIDLGPRNSFGVAERAARLAEWETARDLRALFDRGRPARWDVLAGGNNILFTGFYDGVLLTPVCRAIRIVDEGPDAVVVRADAGAEWDDLVAWSVGQELWGLENLTAIPGKAGAAPVQNIGAYGAEAADTIVRVHAFDPDSGAEITLDAAHCGFGYRESVFKHALRRRAIITAVDFRLSRTPRPRLGYGDLAREVEALGGPTLPNIRAAVAAIRRAKLPDPRERGNAGSFFKNPVVAAAEAERLSASWPGMPRHAADGGRVKLAAGWLIEQAGLKGYCEGPAGVHERQALVLVNLGGATGGDILRLARTVQRRVAEKFGIAIETEVNIW